MLKNKRALAIMLAFVMVFTMLAPAFAATTNTPTGVPNVGTGDDKALGNLIIRENKDTEGFFKNGDVVTINLPSGVKFDKLKPTVAADTYFVNADAVVAANNQSVTIVAGGDSFVSFQINGDRVQNTNEGRITVSFPSVKIDSGFEGDIKVEVDAAGTSITSGTYTVARVLSGNTKTTVSKVETVGLGSTGDVATIRITETSVGVLKTTESNIELVLPNNFKWIVPAAWTAGNATAADKTITGTQGLKAEYVKGHNARTLEFKVTGQSGSSQPGFLPISGLKIEVDDKARVGEVEMTVKGNKVTREDIVVIKTGDFGFKVETKGDIKTRIAGKADQEIAEIRIDDIVDGSWIPGRTVILSVPKGVEFTKDAESHAVNDDRISAAKLNEDNDELRLTVASGAKGEAKFDKLKVNLDADAKAGDLVVKISGSAGITGELVVAKIAAPFTVKAEKPQFQIGLQNQKLGNITITEPEDGAVEEGKWVIFRAPVGMKFAKVPTVKVTDGDMKIDEEDVDENFFAFRIKTESSKEAAALEISDIQMTLDRTVPVGDITFEVFMTKTGKVDPSDAQSKTYIETVSKDFDKATDRKNYTKVTDVVVGSVVTPAPGSSTAVFTIGSTIYFVDGVAKIVEAAPYIKDGRTFVPVRAAAEATGAVVEYDEATRTVTATKDGKEVKLVIGQVGASGVAPEVINGRTFVPIRDMEALGLTLGYDPLTKQVVVK